MSSPDRSDTTRITADRAYIQTVDGEVSRIGEPSDRWVQVYKFHIGDTKNAVFCLLLNKVQFVRDSSQLSINTLSQSRATLCEILAIRVLRACFPRAHVLADS